MKRSEKMINQVMPMFTDMAARITAEAFSAGYRAAYAVYRMEGDTEPDTAELTGALKEWMGDDADA